MIRTVISCSNDCLALSTFLIEAHFAPPADHFKLLFGVTTCTTHPLRALPTTMVRWNRHALNALLVNVLRSTCFYRSTASVCSSCKWKHGHEITSTRHKSARMLNKNRRQRWPRHRSFMVITCKLLVIFAELLYFVEVLAPPLSRQFETPNYLVIFLLLQMPHYQQVVG